MRRRSLLRLLAGAGVAGLTGCAPGAGQGTTEGTVAAPGADSLAPAPAPPTEPGHPTPTTTPGNTPGNTPEPTSEPDPTPTHEPMPRSRSYVPRAQLGLADALPGGTTHTISGLMLHHTAVDGSDVTGADERFRSFDRHHRGAGFVDVAYHWGVTQDGRVLELRDEALAGETFTDYDPAGWLLVVCDGNFEVETPPAAMLDAVVDVLAAGAARYDVDPATLAGHRDLAATACPGQGLQALLPQLLERVAATLATGGVELVTT